MHHENHEYHPARVAQLTQRSRQAVGELSGIRSSDPAAAEAMTALAALEAVIASRLIPATTAVGVLDPLGPNGLATPIWGPGAWWDRHQSTSTPPDGPLDSETNYRDLSDDELFTELERFQQRDLPVGDDGLPDMDDPFWDDFEPLAAELARRSWVDDAFGDQLSLLASQLILIPFAIVFADFDPSVVANMTIEAFQHPQWLASIENNYRAVGAELLLDFLTDHPEIALETLADPVNIHGEETDLWAQLLLWPLLDSETVTAFLDAAMGAPFAPPQHRGLLMAAGQVLQDLVDVANGNLFPDGFHPALSPTIAQIVVQYLPFFVTSLEGNVHLKDFEFRDLGIKLGGHEEVVDLFGALMRDPVSLLVLEQAVLVLSALSDQGDGPLGITMDDVANYSLLLREAAINEQREEALDALDDEQLADTVIDLTFNAIDRITKALGPAAAGGVDIPFGLIETGVRALADWVINETDLGLDDVPTVTAMLAIMGMAAFVLRARRDDDEDQDEADEQREDIELAEALLEEINDDLASGESLESIEGKVENLGRVIAAIDEDAGVFLDDQRVALPDYDAGGEVDRE